MNHPNREDWVPYLFGEAKPEDRRRLKQHLQDCGTCREEIESWKRSLGRLDAWKLPRATPSRPGFEPLLKWAAAAAVVFVLGVGICIGRLTSATANAERVRAAIEPELRQQLRQEFAQMAREEASKAVSAGLAVSNQETKDLLAEYLQASDAKRIQDNQAFQAAIQRLEAQRLADLVSLKKDLDTVAVNTDAGLRHTEQQLVLLAGDSHPARVSHPSQEQSH